MLAKPSILSNLLINLNFVRARFEFNIKWLNVCDLKTLNFRLLRFLLFYIKKRINVQKYENERACEALVGAIVVAVVIVIA